MKTEPNTKTSALLARLGECSDDNSRRKLFARHPKLVSKQTAEHLCDEARKTWRVDTQKALRLAEAALAIATRLRSPALLGQCWRTQANALYFRGQHRAAVETHEKALGLFRELGNQSELARTLSASIQPLILLGEHERAHQAAAQAREIFSREDNHRRLAHLEINVGNIFHRQDRFDEAMACYDRGYQTYLGLEDAEGMAVAMHNSAVSLICLNDFPRALATYQRSRELSEQHGMPLLVAQADYNIAYLYFFRGEYSRAITMLRAVREACPKVGDCYHHALTYLDLSEIYLELNLSSEAAEMAQEATKRFDELGMGYESAKALTFLAIALSQQGKGFLAAELFEKARGMFVREQNRVWPWLTDLYRAVILFNEGRLFEARRLCSAAFEFFRSSALPSKAVLCQLLLAQLALRAGEHAKARSDCSEAISRLSGVESPALGFQAHCLMGQIEEAAGNPQGAYGSYQSARDTLESLRSHLRGEELKIAFMKNKLEVYEALVELCLARNGKGAGEEAFTYMEQAKSRSLMDLLFSARQVAPVEDSGQSQLVRKVRSLREELNWYYHRIEQEHLRDEAPSPQRIQKLQEQTRSREDEFLRALHELPASEPESLGIRPSTPVTLSGLRAALPAGAALVEYFAVRDRFFAALVTGDSLQVLPLTPVSRVRNLLHLLQFQLSKFRLGPEYMATFARPLHEATLAHLQELHRELLAPLLQVWQGGHVVIVPHGILHYVPFHALHDGRQYLLDACTVSYAPSATIYALCHNRPANTDGPSLILGAPDLKAPYVLEEVQSVARAIPQPDLFVGEKANVQTLKEKGPRCRLIHIAAHGHFREDNPMFSGIQLGTSYLSLYDLYHLQLPAELVTLSGCATGLNVVAAGDELLGLVRGLLCAGAQSLLLTLWEVHDRSTAQFMSLFYANFARLGNKSAALREAMIELRQQYPHPYFWAPFLLVGKALP